MKTKYVFTFLLILSFFSINSAIAAGEEDQPFLIGFAEDLSSISDMSSETYWVLFIVLIAVAIYVYYIWRDYEKDDDFLTKKY
ncbi:hypothetical protein LJC08_01135 [Methanimicrococcus sp. OttesenSCG-928-J09]|nr:hypothetical protein [Methanimicrococcus sp. OttesenSCG-928-J09]